MYWKVNSTQSRKKCCWRKFCSRILRPILGGRNNKYLAALKSRFQLKPILRCEFCDEKFTSEINLKHHVEVGGSDLPCGVGILWIRLESSKSSPDFGLEEQAGSPIPKSFAQYDGWTNSRKVQEALIDKPLLPPSASECKQYFKVVSLFEFRKWRLLCFALTKNVNHVFFWLILKSWLKCYICIFQGCLPDSGDRNWLLN